MAARAVSQSTTKDGIPRPSLPETGLAEVASRHVWDVVVVGAGIAGATIAQLLAGHGCAVLLVEKKAFPRYKVCGCCLNLRSLRYLEALGLTDRLDRLGAPLLDSVALHAGGYSAQVDLPGGRALSRSQLDSILVEAACSAGADWLPETVATLDRDVDPTGRSVHLTRDGETVSVRARLVIAADGLGGSLFESGSGLGAMIAPSSRIGLGALASESHNRLPAGIIQMYCGKQGYVGAVVVEGGAVDLAASVQREALRESGGPAACIATIFDEAGQKPPVILEELGWRGTPPLTRRSRGIHAERLVVLGDAAGYIEPFTGEGMAWAFESAFQLKAHLEGREVAAWGEGVQSWARACNNGRGNRHLWCRSISAGLRQPALTSMAVRLLARVPSLCQPVVSGLNRIARS